MLIREPVWFGPAERPRFGWLAAPPSGVVRGGVVLCRPMGEEGRATHRTFRRLSESLAEAGFAALVFDYDGTGDSAGGQHDPERVAAWLTSVDDAVHLLRSAGAPAISLVGMRLGATLAATWAARESSPDLSSLVLWDPCDSGRRFLREGEALHRLGEGNEAGGAPDDGLRHTPGFQYDAETAADLGRLSFGRLAGRRLADRVLLLARSDRPGSAPDPATLSAAADVVDVQEAHGQHLLMDEAPSDVQVPTRALEDVVSWLAASPASSAAPLSSVEALPGPTVGSQPSEVAAGVSERVVRLGEVGVVGVVTEPAAGVAEGAPWIVLVNVAVEHHIGPGRRWVDLARDWATRGHRSVRIDLTGVGDSPTRPGQPENVIFAPEWLDDLPQVVGALGAEGRVVMVGLCSGAYSSFEAALRTEPGAVRAIFAVNPRLTLYEAAYDTLGHTRGRLAGTTPSRPVVWLARRQRVIGGGLWRLWRQVALWHAPYRYVRRVARRGTYVELVACPDDGRHFGEVVAWRPSRWWQTRRRRLLIETDDRLDHSLLGRGPQDLVAERATAFVTRVAREAAEGASAPSGP